MCAYKTVVSSQSMNTKQHPKSISDPFYQLPPKLHEFPVVSEEGFVPPDGQKMGVLVIITATSIDRFPASTSKLGHPVSPIYKQSDTEKNRGITPKIKGQNG